MSFRGVFLALTICVAVRAQQSCEKLADLKLPHTEITSAALVPAGPMPASPGLGATPLSLPARCVVKAIARPTSDSEIKFEVWLPASGWNGKYQQQGNGGWAGAIPTSSLAYGLLRGYATAGTDDGHSASAQNWAIGHPEKLIDFGYRSLHETSAQSKAIISAFYGKPAERNYFFGCSDGGREALMVAQRYPEDFDGIIAGAPANNWSRLMTGFIWDEQALLKTPASSIPPAKLPAIQKASIAACDAIDGVKDSLIEDPRQCHFDPSVMLCKGADNDSCLTAPQVEAIKKIYAGPKNPRTGQQIFPGYEPGTEAIPNSWNWIITSPAPNSEQSSFGNGYFSMAVYEDPQWNFRSLEFDADVAFSDEKGGSVLNSTNPDLRTFRAHGGKLIQYHGWGDAAIAPRSSIEYYEKVRAFLTKYPDPRSSSKNIGDFYRLFMVPGMAHCGAGLGPNSFGNYGLAPIADADHDVVRALERWVEQGIAPEKIIGTGTVVDDTSKKLTRPLCPYPQVARYKGSGDINDAASFVCAVPK